MKKYSKLFLAVAVLLLFAANAGGATLDKEGQAWLKAHTDPPKINVSGTWHAEKWGDVLLIQDAANGQLKGHGDEWHIHGVVSGNRIFLLFTGFGDIYYSAILTATSDTVLDGVWSKKLLSEGAKGETMHLVRTAESVAPPPAAGAEAKPDTGAATSTQLTAKIVLYREHAFTEHKLKPWVILDNETMAWIPDRKYMTLLVTPGKHTILLERSVGATVFNLGIGGTQGNALLIYATAEQPGYAAVEVASWSGTFSARLAEPEEAKKALAKLSPVEAKVVDPEVSDRVSIDPIK